MPEREYSPEFLSNQMEGFKYALESRPAGREVLQIINQENARGMHKVGGGPYMDGVRYLFPNELKADFDRLAQPPYVDCLKDAVYIIDLDLKLMCWDSETRIEYTVLFEHTDQGVVVRKSETESSPLPD